MAGGGSQWRAYLIGFLVGVLTTVGFFYFELWTYFASTGDKVERRVKRGVEDIGEKVEDTGENVKDKTDQWIDTNFKK